MGLKTSKTKTFQKGDELSEALDFLIENIETHDYQPEGTHWSGGEPCPMDPRCDFAHKYIITRRK